MTENPLPLDPTALVSKTPVIPVLTIERAADAVPLARALVAGGLPVIEVTLRTKAALDAIKAIAAEVPDCVVGVGTVTKVADIAAAIAAGAKYLVSPGTPSELAAALSEASVPVLPGCATVSEAMALAARGFRVLKFFPAEASGGVAWLRFIAAPLPELKFCPTGGVDSKNIATYLACPNVLAVGGSWVAPKDAIASGDFTRITQLAREASHSRARAA
jgi:2-dehydro-3-deoxyphosphogluconate aldolase/(4S)-4-hydroxy-2-oxoglutarate aldolase